MAREPAHLPEGCSRGEYLVFLPAYYQWTLPFQLLILESHKSYIPRARPDPLYSVWTSPVSSLSPDMVTMFGRLTHYAFDAVLFSAFLAGVKRSTGLTPSLDSDKITDNKDFKKWIDSYLGVGEWVMDQSVAVLGSTSYFERRR
ncbi:hypothetical protein BDV27DRAFT_38219 [Aspergillus caelatus]|uniref:DUF1748-domain-containing protein n=5 Tax=Aspergillaceae TaxID=1131492 RepID=A0A5N6ZTN7_9EURO|nr:uncharacterized protein BDV27DRAFT_38219 [Aspergillus caelatus]KAE8360613.1 hypothetical protein BDV27DRAFT_38219 [Aspergillus caelatus]